MWHSSHPQAPEPCLTTEHWGGYSLQDGYSLAVSMADPMAVSLTELLANYKDLTEDTEHPAVPKYTFTHQPALPYPKCNHLTSAWFMHVPQCVNMKYNQSHIGNCNSPTLKKQKLYQHHTLTFNGDSITSCSKNHFWLFKPFVVNNNTHSTYNIAILCYY